jgi:hypothetical protein
MAYDTSIYNAVLYNDTPITFEASFGSSDEITFNGFGLKNNDIVVTKIQPLGALREREGYPNPNRDGVTKSTDFFRENSVVLNGYIFKKTASELEQFIDTMLSYLVVPDKYLVITKAHKQRRFLATLQNTQEIYNLRENFMTDFTPFELVFEVSDPPYGEDTFLTSYTFEEQNLNSINTIIQNTGSVNTYLQLFMRFTVAVGLTKIEIENETTGELVTIEESINSNDFIEINSNIFKDITGRTTGNYVKINDTLYNDWTGVLPTLTRDNRGLNSITTTLTSVGQNVDIYFNTRMRYLL